MHTHFAVFYFGQEGFQLVRLGIESAAHCFVMILWLGYTAATNLFDKIDKIEIKTIFFISNQI